MPMAVAYPETEDDIRTLLGEAMRRGTHLIPRAGGTSIAGQVVGSGIVMDVSRHMNRILEIDPERRLVRVQPGVVRDELNEALRPYGLFFSPETSTSNRCCIGGMVGNNSCGTHSLIYGSTRHHVMGLRVMLTDGTVHELHVNRLPDSHSPVMDAVRKQLVAWQTDKTLLAQLREAFPDEQIQRRSCGYALDECLDAAHDGVLPLNLPALITGSEGTLCVVTEVTLSLDPLPEKEQMVVCAHLDDMDSSWEANLMALRHAPTAVELLDGKIIDLARTNPEASRNLFFVEGQPASIVIAEFRGDSREEIERQAAAFEKEVGTLAYECTRVDGADVSRVWALRKAGLGVLANTEGDSKPVGVVEDTAVAPERMGAYMHDFREMMAEMGLDCVYYGHISTGELHLRPVLDLKRQRDRELFRRVAERTAALVKKHRGCLSGEHGDGRLRGEFIPLMYGEEVYELMRAVKRTFDPHGLLNMGKIVDTPPMDSGLRYEAGQGYAALPDTPAMRELMQRVERCNGAGDCRKSQRMGGTMCPAFKATGEELYATRARANVLREKLTHDSEALRSEEIRRVLDSCLACKACRTECPSNVDMTRLRSEVLQLIYDESHTPVRTWLIAHMAQIESLGGMVAPVYNFFAQNRWTSAVIKGLVGFAAERHIPTLSRHSMRWYVEHTVVQPTTPKGKVYLFADEFTDRESAELGLQFAELLTGLGYEVAVPKHVESGRAAISKGCLRQAAKIATKNVTLLRDVVTEETPLVGIEPSCILSFRDEYPRLVEPSLTEDAKRLGKSCLLYDEWFAAEIEAGRITAADFGRLDAELWLHGHCHQKALVGVEKTAEVLRLIEGLKVHIIPSGCCGMAGSFGYEKRHYLDSKRIAEMVLAPTIRRTRQEQPDAIVCAPGTSCRTQIKDMTGVVALHPIEVLSRVFLKKKR